MTIDTLRAMPFKDATVAFNQLAMNLQFGFGVRPCVKNALNWAVTHCEGYSLTQGFPAGVVQRALRKGLRK